MLDPVARLTDNAFHVLGLPPDCDRAAVEREGQKLLGLLALGLAQGATYDTPLGPRPRTPELVRQAMADLRDPNRRLLHEFWASVSPDDLSGALESADESASRGGWPGARRAMGWAP